MDRIIFLHIPKTGGISIKQMLFSHFADCEVFPATLPSEQATYSIEDLNRYRIFHGHLDWAALDCLTGEKFILTILRSPRDRIISNYYFWKELAQQSSREELIQKGLPHLADLKDYASMYDYFFAERESVQRIVNYTFNNMYAYYFATRQFGGIWLEPKMQPDKVLRNAVRNLEKLSFVGITEHMELTIHALTPSIVRERIETVVHAHKTQCLDGKREAINREIRSNRLLESKMQEFTALDDVIYRGMRSRFMELNKLNERLT